MQSPYEYQVMLVVLLHALPRSCSISQRGCAGKQRVSYDQKTLSELIVGL